MRKGIISNIFKFLTKRSTLKIASIILILGLFFIMPTFAAEAEPSMLADTQSFLTKLIGFLSWVWIFLAIIAGKLMTNDLVYGTFMHLDQYLRDIWNIMKNFANFALAFMIIFSIIKHVVKKGDSDNPQKIVVKALLAGVLIQMSWFVVGALVDVSTIATSAIAAFPAKFASTSNLENQMKSEIGKIQQVYVAKFEDGKINRETPQPISDEGGACEVDDIDSILPKYDSVSGPLIFIGMSSLKIQNYMDTETIANGEKLGGIIINFALKALILIFFTLTLILLCIANLVRILFLWLLVLAAPIVVLMSIFDKKVGESGKFAEYFNWQTFVDLIFKPVFFIGFLSLTLILITSMQQIMGNGKGIEDIGGITISTTTGTDSMAGSSKVAVKDVAEFSINEDIFKDFGDMDPAKSVFVDMFIIFLTLILLWKLLEWSITFGKGPVQDIMGKVTPLITQRAKSLPIVPSTTGERGYGITSLLEAKRQAQKKLLEDGLKVKSEGSEAGRFFEGDRIVQSRVNEFLGIGGAPWSEEDYIKLRKTVEDRNGDFFGTLQTIGTADNRGKTGGISLGNPKIKKLVEDWVIRNKDNKAAIASVGFNTTGKYQTLDELLGKDAPETISAKANRMRLHELLGGDASLRNPRKGIPTYDDLMKNQYHLPD